MPEKEYIIFYDESDNYGKYYSDKDFEGLRDQEVEIIATHEVFQAQVEKYNDIGENIASYSDYCELCLEDIAGKLLLNTKNRLIYSFSKHRGEQLTDHLGYAR
ncbi:MAG: hypothetical protein K9J16_00040 [Melioribacteraceae bacterium]|nr:hypothetical protein [Melioribacteraceae bacterium]MCF8353898.1 hypothetical protein [Melioribacteraceae bacterium]MCF8392655.1 hypothetical protein [Melioribacteraceae bacterium]MCF8417676.1 hypothetical protein [Melioribacteraceae bacterium]